MFEEKSLRKIAIKSGETLIIVVMALSVLGIFTEYIVKIIETMWSMAKAIIGG